MVNPWSDIKSDETYNSIHNIAITAAGGREETTFKMMLSWFLTRQTELQIATILL